MPPSGGFFWPKRLSQACYVVPYFGNMYSHPFDEALSLTPDFDAVPGQFLGRTSQLWWNMVGPFGGITAAIALKAVMLHPDRLGDPIALTVNYAHGVAKGVFRIVATPMRTNRSTQHWALAMYQTSADGVESVALTGTAITAVRRQTWGASDRPMPQAVPAETLERLGAPPGGLVWFDRYDMRSVSGALPIEWNGEAASPDPLQASLTQLWIRDEPPRPLDFTSLAAMSDCFFPRVWLRRAVLVPAGTVSMTVYFHCGASELTDSGAGYLLAQAGGQAYFNGFFDQTGHMWSPSGVLLSTTHQLVYFKE